MSIKTVQTQATQIILKPEIYRYTKLSLPNQFSGQYYEVARTLLCASPHGACVCFHSGATIL